MSKSVLFLRDNTGEYSVLVKAIPDWEGFEKLVKFLEINYQANVLESYDGPGARRWIIEVQNKIIELIHDDGYGNYFLAPTVESEEILNTIGKDLENRLSDV